MKKILITSVSSLMLFSTLAVAETQTNEVNFDQVKSEWAMIAHQASILPSSKMYSGDFQSIANQQNMMQLYAGAGSSKMMSIRSGRF